MLRDEAVTRVRRALGHNNSLEVQYIIDALQDAQDSLELEPELPWFLRTEVTSIYTAVGEERIPLPSDFLTIVEDDALWLYDVDGDGAPDWTELPKEELDLLRTKFGGSEPAQPQAYALDKDYFRLFPTPDAAYQLKMIYMQRQESLATNVENGWLKYVPWLLIAMAVQQVASGTRDKDAVVLMQRREADERARLDRMNVGREMTNRSPVQIGGPD